MKFVISSLEEVAEPLRGEYEERNGQFVLKTEGEYTPLVEANRKLAEFRDNNRTLNSKVTTLQEQLKAFDGITVEEHTQLKSRIADLEKSGITKDTSVADAIKKAVKDALEPVEAKLRERERSEAEAQAKIAQQTLENKIREIGIKAGVEDLAVSDFIHRGIQVFKLVDGEPAARKGDAPIFSKKNPADELSLDEWASDLRKEAPFLFKPSNGGGANNRGGAGGAGVKKIISSDPMEFGQNLEGIAKGEVIVQD